MLDGDDIHDLPDTTLRSRVAMVFQQPNPFPMSIFDNVAFALREQSRKKPRRRELEPLVAADEVEYALTLPGEGGEAEVFFSDLSEEYVTYNADYTS